MVCKTHRFLRTDEMINLCKMIPRTNKKQLRHLLSLIEKTHKIDIIKYLKIKLGE